MKLNLACGRRKLDGWVNVDISLMVNPDFVYDLTQVPFPWEDNSIDEIYCSHFVEHVGDVIPFMDEAHRILKPGGIFRVRCPYYTSIRAWQDPTHKRPISEGFFYYFSAKMRKSMMVEHYGIKSDFDIQDIAYHFPEHMKDMPNDERDFMRCHAWNTVADIEVWLKKHDPLDKSLDRQENGSILLT